MSKSFQRRKRKKKEQYEREQYKYLPKGQKKAGSVWRGGRCRVKGLSIRNLSSAETFFGEAFFSLIDLDRSIINFSLPAYLLGCLLNFVV